MKTPWPGFLLAAAMSLGACAPSREQFEKADFGAYPSDARKAVDNWLEKSLIDPDSRKVDFTSGPDRYFWALSNPQYGYLVCGTVNARNRMGGYTGREPFWAMVRNGNVISGAMKEPEDQFWIAPPPCHAA